jgi:hypothetical protein
MGSVLDFGGGWSQNKTKKQKRSLSLLHETVPKRVPGLAYYYHCYSHVPEVRDINTVKGYPGSPQKNNSESPARGLENLRPLHSAQLCLDISMAAIGSGSHDIVPELAHHDPEINTRT